MDGVYVIFPRFPFPYLKKYGYNIFINNNFHFMDKSKINYIIDALMAVSFFITAVTGLILFFFLPSGVQQGRFQELWGMPKYIWTALHDWSGIILIIFVFIHIVLHWGWIACMTKKHLCRAKKCDQINEKPPYE
jgi:cytochrome b subunit of formate dehydrogenase